MNQSENPNSTLPVSGQSPRTPGCCPSSGCSGCPSSGFTRRSLLAGAGVLAAAAPVLGAMQKAGEPARRGPLPAKPLTVQPVFVYRIPTRRQATSWREWGGIQTQQDVEQEKERINRELVAMRSAAGFPIEFLPLKTVDNPEQAAAAAKGAHDTLLMYAAGGNVRLYEALTDPNKYNLMFVRFRSGPVYLWYEIAHARFLRKTVDEFGQPGVDHQDVVVDSQPELLWRMRAHYALKNTLGKRIVAVGNASGWGQGGRKAPEISRNTWKMDIREVSYETLGERIKRARQDERLLKRCREEAARYMKDDGIKVETDPEFVSKAFVLTEVFRELLQEAEADAFTINHCMGTVMGMSETTACLPLTILNDEGCLAFCESDFVVIPSGVLLHYIAGTPVFLNDPTYPHDGLVTIAHCTAPRRMDGTKLEPARLLTHFESDYGAAPKVEMRKGAKVTNLIPDFNNKRWVGFEGEVVDNPFIPICRSQVDVQFRGDTDTLNRETGGFHWMTSYGTHLKETAYALKKVGVDFLKI